MFLIATFLVASGQHTSWWEFGVPIPIDFSHDQTAINAHLRTKILETVGGVCSEVLGLGDKGLLPLPPNKKII
jgi:hypothetical protein